MGNGEGKIPGMFRVIPVYPGLAGFPAREVIKGERIHTT
jgi:hypothetical protein